MVTRELAGEQRAAEARNFARWLLREVVGEPAAYELAARMVNEAREGDARARERARLILELLGEQNGGRLGE